MFRNVYHYIILNMCCNVPVNVYILIQKLKLMKSRNFWKLKRRNHKTPPPSRYAMKSTGKVNINEFHLDVMTASHIVRFEFTGWASMLRYNNLSCSSFCTT